MIQAENLTKYYGDLAAIKDVSFNVDTYNYPPGFYVNGY